MPEARHHHVLDRPRLAIHKLHHSLFNALTGGPVHLPQPPHRRTGERRNGCRASEPPLALTGSLVASRAHFGGNRLPVQLGVGEMMMGLHEVIDGELILAFKQPSPTFDDLLEFDHRVDRSHQNDISNVSCIDSCR